MGFMPSSDCGNPFVAFFKKLTIQPATKPAMRAPRKPEPVVPASAPPTKPTASPGRSAIDMAINPASTGSIKPKEAPPMSLKNFATGVFEPKFDGSML